MSKKFYFFKLTLFRPEKMNELLEEFYFLGYSQTHTVYKFYFLVLSNSATQTSTLITVLVQVK